MFSCNVLLKTKFSFEDSTTWFEKEKKKNKQINKTTHKNHPNNKLKKLKTNKQTPQNQMGPTFPVQISLQQ